MRKKGKTWCYLVLMLIVSANISLFSQSKGLFYEIKSEKGTVYVLGSFHALKPEFYPLSPVITEKYAASDYLVLEINISPGQNAKILKLFTQYGLFPEGESLKKAIPPQLYRKLKVYFKENYTDIKMYDNFKPWYLAMVISMMSLQQAGYSANLGVDSFFAQLAGADKKEILELESIEFQITLFDSFSPADQISYLESALKESTEAGAILDKLAAAWAAGDSALFDALVFASYKGHEDEPFYKKLFTDRNIQMARKIAGYLETGKTHFIIVGAGHLVGETGIPVLLGAEGFQIRQIK